MHTVQRTAWGHTLRAVPQRQYAQVLLPVLSQQYKRSVQEHGPLLPIWGEMSVGRSSYAMGIHAGRDCSDPRRRLWWLQKDSGGPRTGPTNGSQLGDSGSSQRSSGSSSCGSKQTSFTQQPLILHVRLITRAPSLTFAFQFLRRRNQHAHRNNSHCTHSRSSINSSSFVSSTNNHFSVSLFRTPHLNPTL